MDEMEKLEGELIALIRRGARARTIAEWALNVLKAKGDVGNIYVNGKIAEELPLPTPPEDGPR